MNRTELPTANVPVWVVLRDDGGPREYLQDVDREPGSDEWACRITWRLTEDAGRVRAVELQAPDREAIASTAWRWVRLGEVIRASREALEVLGYLGQLSPQTREVSGQVLAALTLAGDRDRSGYTREHFVAVADAYNLAVSLGDRYPVRTTRHALTEALDWEPSEATVKGWVRVCKDRGLITTTARPSRAGKGRAGQ